MKYSKPPKTLEQQADILINRGLITERKPLISFLTHVNYYRITGYLYPFKLKNETYQPGTTFEMILRRYTFDRKLRIHIMEAIEQVEVALRTQLVEHFTKQYGAFGYTEKKNLPKMKEKEFDQFLEKFTLEKNRSREIFVKHFKKKYGNDHKYLPLWMATEIISFGVLVTFFRGVEPKIKHVVASHFGITQDLLTSWMGALHVVRNICAHHGRLVNRILGYKPLIPYKHIDPQWHEPVEIKNDRVFAILTILKYFLDIIDPKSDWSDRLVTLLNQYGDIPLKSMGFPKNWLDSELWKDCRKVKSAKKIIDAEVMKN